MKSITMKSRFARTNLPQKKFVTGLWIIMLLIGVVSMPGCKKPDNPTEAKSPGLQLVLEGLVSPLTLSESPDKTKRLFVVDQIGKIWIIGADGTRMAEPFIDVASKMVTLSTGYDERGLLGFAFHPQYNTNGKFYIFYSAPPRSGGPAPGVNWNNLVRVSEFKVSASNPNKADINSEKVILEVNHPQSNHNGGTIAFGADGYLYISIGDGGGANDTPVGHVPDWYLVNAGGNGQDVYANLLGNILRIDINGGTPYRIPSDNPFVKGPGLPEIYAYGFRNPYRFSFDMGGTHELYAGDAGQVLWEEIDIVKKGGNYGWNVKEGTHCFNTDTPSVVRKSCPLYDTAGNPLLDPIIELTNAATPGGGLATTIVGGNVYRGKEIANFAGRYIFGIYGQAGGVPNGKLFIANRREGSLWTYDPILLKNYPDNLGAYLKGFGQDLDGEIYIMVSSVQGPTGANGKIYKIAMVGKI
ncbi:MAG: PQQ-dependent sugar dehydrogenase [Chitinophagaceae bacterium]